jgi:hypothetical protein
MNDDERNLKFLIESGELSIEDLYPKDILIERQPGEVSKIATPYNHPEWRE